jgi:hypothetical protein
MTQITLPTHEDKPTIDVAKPAHTMRASSSSFRALVREYQRRGVTTAEIVEAMAASPRLIDPLGRAR